MTPHTFLIVTYRLTSLIIYDFGRASGLKPVEVPGH